MLTRWLYVQVALMPPLALAVMAFILRLCLVKKMTYVLEESNEFEKGSRDVVSKECA